MQNIKNILIGIWYLLINIMFTAYQLIRKLILPGLTRKGNVLGSIFLLFIDTAEKIIAFEKEIFHSSRLIRIRFVKQALIVVTAFLFLLSSVEWTTNTYRIQNTEQEENSPVTKTDETVFDISISKQVPVTLQVKKITPHFSSAFSPPFFTKWRLTTCKRFLLFCVHRV